MQKALEGVFNGLRPKFEGKDAPMGWAWPMFEGAETFFLTPNHATHKGAHVRDRMDMKRLMIFVLYALAPCILMGAYNVGQQGFIAEGNTSFTLVDALIRGLFHMIPVIAVSYTAGGLAELVFCIVRKHEINEGFLVTAMLYPLTLPPTIPLWMAAVGIIFGVVIGKEVFGGVGMNILNPALTARAFVFFTYPAAISGAKVWDVGGSWWPMGEQVANMPDAYTGATPLLAVNSMAEGADPVAGLDAMGWTFSQMAMGNIPGSMGEVSAVAALLGAIFLIVVGIASWETMVGCVVGLLVTAGFIGTFGGAESAALFNLPFYYHLVMGGFAFGAVFMATDPVSSPTTKVARLFYGVGIGALCVLVRVLNPAYPEGMMLAILFMNVFAPLLDYIIVKRSTYRRAARIAAA